MKEAMEGPVKMFNIIDHESGYKADFVVLKDDPFRLEEFRRRLKVDYFGKTIMSFRRTACYIEADLDTRFSIRYPKGRY